MPILSNPRHEAYAQARAKLIPAGEALKLAGYRSDARNGTRMTKNEEIAARIAELQAASVSATTLTVNRRREICAEIAENSKVEPHVRIAATLAEAKHAGELTEKLSVTDATPREPIEVVRARIKSAKLTHGRS